ISKEEVRAAIKRMKNGKSVGPDDIPVEAWRCLGEKAVEFLTRLFNKILEGEKMPEEWRRSVLVLIFKHKGDVQPCSNYRGIKLISHTMKLWERVVEARLREEVTICEQQYGFLPRKSTTDTLFALRMLMEKYREGQKELHCVFVDLEKAYNRVPRDELWYCMRKPGVSEKYVRVVQDMYEDRPLTTVAPQGRVLSPMLFTLLTNDCVAMHSSNHIKFGDDTTVVGLISKNDEPAYREVVQQLTAWCRDNNLSLHVDKTKEIVVDFRRTKSDHYPLIIDEYSMEIIKRPISTKFLGVHLADNLTWSLNTSSITKKAQQRLYFLRRLRKTHLPPPILSMFYRGTIESILSSCITAWFGNCTVSDHKSLQRIVRTAEIIIGVSLPSITDIYTTRCIRKAHSIVYDHTHPSHTLFTLLPSGKRFR
ncbi:gastrula zinc finger protein XlCGF28.1-like, partial [Silurus meridionalis]